MASTLKEIARLAGVSHATVSKALSGRYSVHPGTRERILALAEELKYRPSGLGRALVSGKTQCVGIYFNHGQLPSGSFSSLFEEANHLLQKSGYYTMLMATVDGKDPVPPAIKSRMVDGVIVCHARDATFESYAAEMGLGIVLLNTELANDRDCVAADNEAGMALAVRHLIELGHTQIGFINSHHVGAHISQSIRANGYVRAMAHAGLQAFAGSESNIPIGEAVDNLLRGPRKPTSIICFNDLVAMSVIRELTSRGLKVPEDISVVGCDDEQEAVRYFNPPLTTLRMPFSEMGTAAANRLLSQFTGENNDETTQIRLPLTLVERSSTAPPASAS